MNKRLILILIVLALALTACGKKTVVAPEPTNNNIKTPVVPEIKPTNNPGTLLSKLENQSKIKKFTGLEEFSKFLEENETSSGITTPSFTRSNSLSGSLSMEQTMDAASPNLGLEYAGNLSLKTGSDESGGSDDFSQTNIQVEGVDEADIIKNDGKYIYAVSRKNLFIVKAYPAETSEVLTKIEFKDTPQEIYINNDKLVIFGRESRPIYKDASRFRRHSSYVFFKIFDISDKMKPELVRDLQFEGNYKNSRMIGDYVYLVSENYNYNYWPEEPVLPRIIENDVIYDYECTSATDNCIIPDVYYFDIPYERYVFTSINSVNINDSKKAPNTEHYLMSNSQNMYVSPNNIYITYTKYLSEYELEMAVARELVFPRLNAKDQDKIKKIEAVEGFILSKQDKNQKITQIVERYAMSLSDDEQEALEDELQKAMKAKYQNIAEELEKTVIHKVAINNGDLEYSTNGEVTGSVLNQFSMDESNGFFRIATTKNRTWSRYANDDSEKESYSNLFVLDSNLKELGAVKRLAPGERIYSVRFMQDRAYMVTFKQMDPLFVIDLSTPSNPQVLGELKIPGFSDYLHPYDENILIGIGKDTAVSEWGGVTTKGLKVSLFDVSNVSEPKELDTYVMGDRGSDSLALRDHKAVLFSKEKNLLAFPVRIYEGSGNYYERLRFNGSVVLNVSPDGISLRGRVSHKEEQSTGNTNSRYYQNPVKRNLYIGETLYTMSDDYIKMNMLDTLTEQKNLLLSIEKEEDFKVIN